MMMIYWLSRRSYKSGNTLGQDGEFGFHVSLNDKRWYKPLEPKRVEKSALNAFADIL